MGFAAIVTAQDDDRVRQADAGSEGVRCCHVALRIEKRAEAPWIEVTSVSAAAIML
jgi:hypothetical protein